MIISNIQGGNNDDNDNNDDYEQKQSMSEPPEQLHLGRIFRRKEISLVNVDNEWFATLTVGF